MPDTPAVVETEKAAAAAPTAVVFDFNGKSECVIPAVDAVHATKAGLFAWFDLDLSKDQAAAAQLLRDLGVNTHCVDEVIGPDADGRHDLYDDCLHIAVTAGSFRGGAFTHSHVDVVIGETFLVTLRRGPVEFIEQVRRHYRQDFFKFAKSPSFLLYEVWDYLIENYRKTIHDIGAYVEDLQSGIFGAVDDAIFNQVAGVTRDLLSFRKIMLAAREVLHELGTRRTDFVAETAQPFLERMVGTMERLSSDLAVEREILAETLNLYMGIVSHRTNKVVNRLTVISMIFLPLTFLCGVYGMNFDKDRMMPELSWPHGYKMFWGLCVAIVVGLLAYMKRQKWI
jgi:magnesium transporter